MFPEVFVCPQGRGVLFGSGGGSVWVWGRPSRSGNLSGSGGFCLGRGGGILSRTGGVPSESRGEILPPDQQVDGTHPTGMLSCLSL